MPRLSPQITMPWRAAKGDILLRQGDQTRTVRFLEKGLCRLFFVDEEGHEQTKYFLGPGYFIVPIHSLFLDTESWFSIQAATECSGWQMSAQTFKMLISKHLEWATYFSAYMVRLFIEKENRERDFLTLGAKERYEQLVASAPSLFDDIPLHQIASYLGITDVTLSRIRSARV